MSSRWQGELLILSCSGVLTIRTLGQLRVRVAADLQERDARAIVCDLRSCSLAFTHDNGIDSALTALREKRLVRVPLAFVVAEADLGMTKRYARSMTACGLEREAFTIFRDATAWASGHRGHWPDAPAPTLLSCPSLWTAGCSELGRSLPDCRRCDYQAR